MQYAAIYIDYIENLYPQELCKRTPLHKSKQSGLKQLSGICIKINKALFRLEERSDWDFSVYKSVSNFQVLPRSRSLLPGILNTEIFSLYPTSFLLFHSRYVSSLQLVLKFLLDSCLFSAHSVPPTEIS